jgi:hypothetical protein
MSLHHCCFLFLALFPYFDTHHVSHHTRTSPQLFTAQRNKLINHREAWRTCATIERIPAQVCRGLSNLARIAQLLQRCKVRLFSKNTQQFRPT